MELRKELTPPVLDERLLERLRDLSEELDGSVAPAPERDRLVGEFNALAGTGLSFADFQGVYGGVGHDAWVRLQLAQRFVRRIPDVSRDELIEIVRRVSHAEGSEYEIGYWVELLQANVPDPRILGMIFQPGDYFGGDGEPTAEQIVDHALSYEPIQLPGLA